MIRQFLLEVKLWVLIYKMRSRNNKSKSNIQRKVIRFFLLIGVAILLITFFFGDHGLYHLYTIKAERKKIQGEIDFLREKRVVLENEKIKLRTDFKYIEEMAREKYRMAKKGEKVFKVIEKKND